MVPGRERHFVASRGGAKVGDGELIARTRTGSLES
jgi:hypothetical protein